MNDYWRFLRRMFLIGTRQLALLILFTFLIGTAGEAAAQFSVQPRQLTPEQMKKMKEMRGRMRSQRAQPQPQPKKTEEKKPEKKEEKKDEGKQEEESKTIKRPTDGTGKLDPNRIRLQPDKNGLVQFNYNGHPWADVLQEYADAAKLSFDWQELPADSLNLVTQQKYTLERARDLLNRHLLARGFTLVVQGEVLSAVKVDKLDPSLVPRVEADDLEEYLPHDFVRVRFQLPQSMDPAKAKEDVKALLSPKAKVIPLLSTKRLLVIDAVVNQRSVRDLIYAEQTAADSIIKPLVYPIIHRRADYVAEQVMIVLGLDPASRKKPQELQIEQQRMQLYAQMQKKGKDISKMLSKDGPKVHVAVDQQQNTILINAPPEVIPTIERTIKQFDQLPNARLGGRYMKRHKVTSASTDAVVTALMEIGDLHPLTHLQSDAKNSTIFASATDEDHEKIEKIIGKLDGSGREIHVVWLKRLPVRNVAGTLMSLFVGDKKKEDTGRRRYSIFGYSQPEQKKEIGFKAQADVENNRLILWANADEMEQVRTMLIKLGETPEGETRNPSKVRVLGGRTPEETAALLERLKAAFPGKLNIQRQEKQPPAQQQIDSPDDDKVTRLGTTGNIVFRTVQLAAPPAAETNPGAQTEPEINIVVTEDGRIVISSDDPATLDQLEDLVVAIEPPREEFHKFALKYADAFDVVLNLKEYFAEELKGQTESVYDDWNEYQGEKDKDLGPATLGRRQLLRFLDDTYTNTVIVQGASRTQLEAIKQLISVYDQPPKSDLNFWKRKTRVISLKYSQARDIQNSLKEVYRELLSSKDKEFQDKDGNQPLSGRSVPYAFGKVRKNAQGEDDPVLVRFEGMLSIGVDEVSNTLIVSAREEVLADIEDTVNALDEAAMPNTTIHVHRVRGLTSASRLQKMLRSSVSQPWPGGKPKQARAARPGGGNSEQKAPENRGRDDSRRRGR